MRFAQRFLLVGLVGSGWFASVACSDDQTTSTGDGGTPDSGTPSSGGVRGTGGRNATGGRGSGGKATGGAVSSGGAIAGGTAGTGGGGSGGKGANGGTGGTAGAGGTSGTGGASGTGGGSGGQAGAGGADASTEAGPNDAGKNTDAASAAQKSCAYHCETDADCLVGTDASPDATFKCNPTRKHCENPIEHCKSNDDCVGFASFWFTACTSDGDCLFPGDVCVDAGGYGLCATPAADAGGCSFPPDRVTRKRFGGSDASTIAVCGSLAGRCDNGTCFTGCDSTTCGAGFGASCNATSGFCECSASTECTASGVSSCDGQTHHCECSKSADCVTPGLDVCVAGTCGCSNASSCPASLFRHATPVCE